MNREEKIDVIMDVICAEYEVTKQDLIEMKRQERFVVPRHISMALISTFTGMNQCNIAAMFGRKNHTIVNYSMNKVADFYKVDKGYAKRIDTIIYKINYALNSDFLFKNVEDKINHITAVTDTSKPTYADIRSKVKEIVEAQNPQLILILVQELKELHGSI
jgi:hypothetical protein